MFAACRWAGEGDSVPILEVVENNDAQAAGPVATMTNSAEPLLSPDNSLEVDSEGVEVFPPSFPCSPVLLSDTEAISTPLAMGAVGDKGVVIEPPTLVVARDSEMSIEAVTIPHEGSAGQGVGAMLDGRDAVVVSRPLSSAEGVVMGQQTPPPPPVPLADSRQGSGTIISSHGIAPQQALGGGTRRHRRVS